MAEDSPITALLLKWRGGDSMAREELIPLVYEHLRSLAGRYMRGEREGHTLAPTALVHEAYLRLADASVAWEDRVHFFAVAARVMRRILVDHAKAAHAGKRGGEALRVTLDESRAGAVETNQQLLALHEALERLSAQDARKGELVEMIFFGGLTYDEAAAVLGVSKVTIHRDLSFARAWLQRELRCEESA